ncbi:TVP38/TMEM64 family protein [Cohnella fermenti]|uniref:TVP38/TMEM64 family membrane protein n=1 Tax=Cohnella fermenti TaxID=2565925 RepID=A0A4S4C752_9BACL|nr:VTT domain-containing protein [Cohnella fermenti]THF83766.1 TVP38/TMEM64 family protein [Cohnella fermenti]
MRRVCAIAAALVAAGFVAAYRNELLAFLGEADYAVVYLIALALVLVPAVPYKVVIATLGYALGPLAGALVSWLAATTASLLVFALARYLFREPASRYLGRFSGTAKLAEAMERRPFLAVLTVRLIPVLPQALVNVYPALTRIGIGPYLLASALGKIPSILLFAYLGKDMFSDPSSFLLFLAAYALVFLIGYGGYRRWAREKRA